MPRKVIGSILGLDIIAGDDMSEKLMKPCISHIKYVDTWDIVAMSKARKGEQSTCVNVLHPSLHSLFTHARAMYTLHTVY